ncbi:hypothetical protein Bca52824_081249 [Brassica carinata]|uniref:Uncharacterized protein n=1 Tax=Brassica carinata TaxID=52824 RepID=A0A8X7PHI2_BRACI|nr:hypothetical protein Bca52824_081249 [Brassica carinata]
MLIVASEEASYFLLLSASTLFAQFSTRKMIRQSFETVSSSMCGRSGWCGVWQLVVHRWFMCLSGLLLLWVEMVARLFSVSQIFSWCQGCEDCPDSGEDLYGLGCGGEGSHGEGYVFASMEVDFRAPISVS